MIKSRTEVAVYQKPKKGNYYCGDSYYYTETENEFICVIADGLGSGEFAKESSQVVINIVKAHIDASVKTLIKMCNQSLMGKRGVVLGLLKIDFDQKHYTFSSVGNIGIVMISNWKKKRNIPNAGFLAGYERPFKVVSGELKPEMRFVVFSDGVTDADLSQPFMLYNNVHELTHAFSEYKADQADDDTTMITIKYTG
ncbi:SpoIIE family protein phosphatase [Lentibacillus saliphilus]|uniref:SpoIIE family protein phosphatase n=1 Tax=Lentibacillus saliphilus TaxID=2737028 RepID=UPI0031BB9392